MKYKITRNIIIFFGSFLISIAQLTGQDNRMIEIKLNSTTLPFACPDNIFKIETKILLEKGNYIWLNNDIPITVGNENYINISQPGRYKVIYRNDTLEFHSNEIEIFHCQSETKENGNLPSVLLTKPVISSSDNVICGNKTEATLTSSLQNPNYIYKWYVSNSYSGTYQLIENANSFTYIATQAGYYKLNVDDGSTLPETSNPFQVFNTPIISFKNQNNLTNSTTFVTVGSPVSYKVEIIGSDFPVRFSITDGVNNKVFLADSSTYNFTLSADQNSTFNISNYYPTCGNYGINIGGNHKIITDPSIDFTLNMNSTVNVCLGQTLSIPYNTTGAWQNQRNFQIFITDPQDPNFFKFYIGQSGSPLKIDLPSNLELNRSYMVSVNSILPASQPNSKTFTIVPTSLNCSPSAFISNIPANEACGSITLNAYPRVSGYLYKWYKNDVSFLESTTPFYNVTSSGNYKVKITNPINNNSTTSENYSINLNLTKPTVTSNIQTLCGNSNGIVLTTSVTDPNFQLQWYYNPGLNSMAAPLIGAKNNSYVANTEGRYSYVISNNKCSVYSEDYGIFTNTYIKATTVNSENNFINIGSGGSTIIKLTLQGEPPFDIRYNDGVSNYYIQTSENVYNLPITPGHSKAYSFQATSTCGYSNNAYFYVTVGSTTNFSLPIPSQSDACKNRIFEIPFTTTGSSWPSKKVFSVYMIDENGFYVNNSNLSDILTENNNIPYFINSNISPGNYRLIVSANTPHFRESKTTTYFITVGSTPCNYQAATIQSSVETSCGTATLRVYPIAGSGNSSLNYSWYRNGQLMYTNNNNSFFVSSSGTYYCIVSNGSNYTSITPSKTFNVIAPYQNYFSNNYCYTGLNLISQFSNIQGNSYQWFYSSGGKGFNSLANTTNIQSISIPGYYKLITKIENCEVVENYTCAFYLTLNSQTLCSGSEINIPFLNYFSNTEFKFQIVDLNNNVIVDEFYKGNLITGQNESITLSLPLSLTPGTYKIKAFGTQDPNIFSLSDAKIIIKNGDLPTPLIISATPETVNGPNSLINISASNCDGNYIWNTDLNSQGQRFQYYLDNGFEFIVNCKSLNGCKGAESTLIVPYNCIDTYEPNNSIDESKRINGDSFLSESICLGYSNDKDWYSFIINGRKYYALIRHYLKNNNSMPVPFFFNKELNDNILTLSTFSNTPGQYYDTVIELYNENKSFIGSNDDGNGNGFSKLIYNFNNSCQTNLEFLTEEYNIYANETSLVKSNNFVKIGIKIMNEAKATFEAQNYILLNPGFETQITNEGHFKAEIKNCN